MKNKDSVERKALRAEVRIRNLNAQSFYLFSILLLSGCSLPIRSEDLPAVLAGLSADHASACLRTGVRGGAGAVAIAPVPSVPAGGYGSAELEFCRTNEPGSEIELKSDGTLTIKHGGAGGSLRDEIDVIKKILAAVVTRIYDVGKGDQPVAPTPETQKGPAL